MITTIIEYLEKEIEEYKRQLKDEPSSKEIQIRLNQLLRVRNFIDCVGDDGDIYPSLEARLQVERPDELNW